MNIEKELKALNDLEKEVKSSTKKEEKTKEKIQTKLSYKEQKDLDTLPDEIERLENEIEALNECLGDPDCYQEKGLNTISEELALLEKVYEEKTDRYLEVLEIYEELS